MANDKEKEEKDRRHMEMDVQASNKKADQTPTENERSVSPMTASNDVEGTNSGGILGKENTTIRGTPT